jgi:hypothetical protein
MEGTSAPNPTIQVDCWATTFKQSQQLAEAVQAALDAYSGLMGGLVQVSSCLQRGRQDLFEPDVNNFRVSLDYSIWYN